MLYYIHVLILKFFCAKKECSTLIFLKGDITVGISYRKRIKLGDGTFLNLSKSGISVSKKVGKTTIKYRGTTTINLGNGVTYRTSNKKRKSNLY